MTPRRVLIITTAFPPSTSAGTHRMLRFVRYLPEFGWTPYVLSKGMGNGLDDATAAALGLPHDLAVFRTQAWGRGDCSSSTAGLVEVVHGVNGSTTTKVKRGSHFRTFARNCRDFCSTTPDKNVWWSLSSVRLALELARRFHPDAVFTSGPPHSTHLIGLALKRLGRIPWVADFRDPWARRPWGPKLANPWGQKLLKNFERACVRHADRVVLNTDRMADEFRTYYQKDASSRFVSIPNGCEPRLTEHIQRLLSECPRPAASRSSPEPVRLCHPGSLYRKRDPRPLLSAIAQLQQSGVAVELEQIGSCAAEFAVESCIQEHHLGETVRFVPPLSHDACLQRMAGADLFVLIQPGTDLQIPGKVFEMMSFGKPIIALADDGATADLIRTYGIGVVAAPSDPQAITNAVREAIARRAELSESNRWERARHDFHAVELTSVLAHELNRAVTSCLRSSNHVESSNGPTGEIFPSL